MPKLAAVKAQQNRVKRRELTSDSIRSDAWLYGCDLNDAKNGDND